MSSYHLDHLELIVALFRLVDGLGYVDDAALVLDTDIAVVVGRLEGVVGVQLHRTETAGGDQQQRKGQGEQ